MAAFAKLDRSSRVRIRVIGTVQGVGFRPYVFRLAAELGLSGSVRNDERGVVIEAEGEASALERLLARLPAEAPPLARVESIHAERRDPLGELGFRIVASERGGEALAAVSPDTATCPECLAELRDPADRRHRYPFINCTNCGPRFSIVTGVPYDRPATTMAGFEMCGRCRSEYDDPGDRRFHAQPNACPACGPRAWLADPEGGELALRADDVDAVSAAARLLRAGAVLAIKGIGGYHLACLASDEVAVRRLRSRKRREERPLALMSPGLDGARELVALSAAEEALLTGRQRPIVIARRRRAANVAPAVAPGSPDLGVMLPYSPLHHLLLADIGAPLVMTSGNLSDEPIAYEDADARERLGAIADALLLHDRPIHVRCDDSVVRSLAPRLRAAPLFIRRSRGYAPESIPMPGVVVRPLLACGGELKNTFCLAKGDRAWVGHHIGDLKNYETLTSFAAGIEHFRRLFAVAPELVAHDLHPDYLSTRYALSLEGVERVAVQHHHAHLAACLAEHGVAGPAVGAIYDGSGLGPDGTVWGGEVLVGDLVGYRRAATLLPVALPGGDAAVREPWRMAASWLAASCETALPERPPALRGAVAASAWGAVCGMLGAGVNSPLTSSAGRLFDAVAALCGVRARVGYEGQAAGELEALADPGEAAAYPMPLIAGPASGPATLIDARETVRALLADLAAGVPVCGVAARFHNGLARATAHALQREAEAGGIGRAVLSGGVFQNRLLLERTAARLREAGMDVLVPVRLPPNDGGISYGQAAVAAARELNS